VLQQDEVSTLPRWIERKDNTNDQAEDKGTNDYGER
jgi:hypothetical protein